MFSKPLISIITPCYNCEKFLSETILSVITQTYTNWELIIIDDCSSDDSYKVAKDFADKEKRILLLKNNVNEGAYYCRNIGIQKANGNYIALLDSDDLWIPSKLEFQLNFMISNNCDFSFSEYELIDENSERLNIKANVIKHLSYRKNLFHNFPGCLTIMYNKDKIGLIQSYKKGNGDDYALVLGILKKSRNAMGIKRILAQYRKHKSSISYNRFKMLKPHFEVLHRIEKRPFVLSLFFLTTHVLILYLFKMKKINNESIHP